MDRRLFLATATAAGLALAAPALAQVSYKDQPLVDQAAAYLQGLKTGKGRFVQTDSRGGPSSGVFYLSRPGKARFEYEAPTQLLIVADGRTVSVYDQRLKTFDRYPLGATPLGIFLSRRIRLDEEVRVTNLTHTSEGFSLTVKDASGNTDGSLTMEFATAPMALRGWTVMDAQGVRTHVRLTDFAPTSGLDPALFVLRDPRRGGG